MLAQRYPRERLNILPRADYHPYPTAAEREAWETLPAELRQQWIRRGETALAYGWPSLLAIRFLDYARNGNRSRYQSVRAERRERVMELLLAECIEGQGRFVDQLVNGVWLILEESFWGAPAHLRLQAAGDGLPDTAEPVVDLHAADTASLLAMVYYLVGPLLDLVSPLIRPRIVREIDHRVTTPTLEREDFNWMGYRVFEGRRPNNWNPFICSGWINSTLLVIPDDERRAGSIFKAMRTLDNFLDPHPRDGGCDEGPMCWNNAAGRLHDCLLMLEKGTGGQISLWDDPMVREMGRYIARVHIAGDWYVNFADAPPVILPDAPLMFSYGQAIGDEDFVAMGAWAAQRQNLFGGADLQSESIIRLMNAVFHYSSISAVSEVGPLLPCDVFLPDIQLMVARDEAGTTDGFFVAAKGANNNESHNHNDVGQFILYLDGNPVILDAGVGEYTSKTFGPNRYDIWTMRSDYHNLPTINGVVQGHGNVFAARDVRYHADNDTASLAADIAGAYPDEAGIVSWQRTVTLRRDESLRVTDQYDLDKPVPIITQTFMTASPVDVSEPGTIKLATRELPAGRRAGAGTIIYDAGILSVEVDEMVIDDTRLTPVWGDRLYRIVLTAEGPAQNGEWAFVFTR
jgi:hypothetical protein